MICVNYIDLKMSFYLKKKLLIRYKFLSNSACFFKYGTVALKLTKGAVFYLKTFNKVLLILKRWVRKPDRTLKKLWLSPNYILRISKSSKGARMGKGKGGKALLISRFTPLSTLIETSNITFNRLYRLSKLLSWFFGTRLLIVSNAIHLFTRYHYTPSRGWLISI